MPDRTSRKTERTRLPRGSSSRAATWAFLITVLVAVLLLQPLEIRAQAPEEPAAPDAADRIIGEVTEATPLDSPLALQARALRGLRAAVIGEVISGREGGDLSLSVLALPLPGTDGRSETLVFLEIDGASFLRFNQSDLARVEIYVYAVSEDQQIRDYLAEVVAVDVATTGERIWQSGLEFFGRLNLVPGTYDLRIMVRNFQSRATGVRSLKLDVPSFPVERPAALIPLFPEPEAREAWIPVRSWRSVGEISSTAYPLLKWGERINPAAQPVLVVERGKRVRVPVANAPAGDLSGSLQLAAANGDGFVVFAESPVTIGERSAVASDIELIDLGVTAPLVRPGSYRARISLLGAAGDAINSTPIDVIVVSGETRERNLVWSDMRWLLGNAPKVAEKPPPPPARGRKRKRQEREAAAALKRAYEATKDDYRQILGGLVDSPMEEVRSELFEFESAAIAGSDESLLEDLHKAELEVAGELASQNRDLVASLVSLHEQMYGRYLSRRLYTLLHHTQSLLEELADVFVDSRGGPKNGAKMLVSLGGYLQESNLQGGSRRLFERAIVWDYQCAPALMGLASNLEKYGDYTAAIALLEQIVELEPEYQEAKLRLAMNLERVGLRRRARGLLEQVVAAGEGGWVGAVAHQELGRLLLHDDQVEAAVELLESATQRLPRQTATLFLLAHAYDRLGRSDTALDRLSRIRPQRRSRRSERWIYDRWPQALLRQARQHVVGMGETALADLPAALEASGGAR